MGGKESMPLYYKTVSNKHIQPLNRIIKEIKRTKSNKKLNLRNEHGRYLIKIT